LELDWPPRQTFHATAQKAEAFKSGKPFMLMMHHKAPHREWQPGLNELSLYKNITFPEPATLFDD
jgi:hypothetical protein